MAGAASSERGVGRSSRGHRTQQEVGGERRVGSPVRAGRWPAAPSSARCRSRSGAAASPPDAGRTAGCATGQPVSAHGRQHRPRCAGAATGRRAAGAPASCERRGRQGSRHSRLRPGTARLPKPPRRSAAPGRSAGGRCDSAAAASGATLLLNQPQRSPAGRAARSCAIRWLLPDRLPPATTVTSVLPVAKQSLRPLRALSKAARHRRRSWSAGRARHPSPRSEAYPHILGGNQPRRTSPRSKRSSDE